MLTIKKLKLGFGNEEILCIDNLQLEKNTITGFLGPSGGGKSSFLKAILRQNSSPSYWEKGEIFLDRKLIDKQIVKKDIGFVSQKARLYTDTVLANFLDGFKFKQELSKKQKRQYVIKIFKSLDIGDIFKHILEDLAIKQSMGVHKILLIVKAIVKKPKLLLLDEVLSNTSVKDEIIIIDLIKRLTKYTTVLLITHNKDEAMNLCDSIALVSGGMLHEHTKCEQFFIQPQSEIGQEFLQSGSAWYCNPNNILSENQKTKEDDLTAFRRFSSLSEFYWVVKDKLGGMQKPGLMTEIKEDLSIMNQLGVDVLVTLQKNPIDPALLNEYDIEGLHFAVVDMDVPELEETYKFILSVQAYFDEGKSVVYHCKAGMGRTGTLLACNLLWLENISGIKAIEKIRQVNHKYIQTDEQMDFVVRFENYIKTQIPV